MPCNSPTIDRRDLGDHLFWKTGQDIMFRALGIYLDQVNIPNVVFVQFLTRRHDRKLASAQVYLGRDGIERSAAQVPGIVRSEVLQLRCFFAQADRQGNDVVEVPYVVFQQCVVLRPGFEGKQAGNGVGPLERAFR